MSRVFPPSNTLNEAMNDVQAKISQMDIIAESINNKIKATQNDNRKKILLKYYKYVTYLINILKAKKLKMKKL
jgi:hypothetical protein